MTPIIRCRSNTGKCGRVGEVVQCRRPTQRALDAGDSAAFSSIFLASLGSPTADARAVRPPRRQLYVKILRTSQEQHHTLPDRRFCWPFSDDRPTSHEVTVKDPLM